MVRRGFFVGLSVIFFCAPLAMAQGKPAPAPGSTLVLDTYSFWRLHHTLRPPIFQGSGLPALVPQKWLNMETTPPPADWKDPDFADGNWVRATAPTVCRTPYLAVLSLRGKFIVSDPQRVKGLSLKLAYSGGAVVYLNGKEAATDHAAPSKSGEMEYADNPGASLATSAPLPTNLLRKGVNVLAIQILRPPFQGSPAAGKEPSYTLSSETCVINQVQLTASSPDGLTPNASRPAGLQAWNSNVLASDCDGDWGNPAEPLRPVMLVGARGGAYSGKIVVGSSKSVSGLKSISGLKAVAGELKSADGAIPASAVVIRYALPWGRDSVLTPRCAKTYPGQVSLLSALSEIPPAAASVVPVWITVNVPRDAKPGSYSGAVHIEAAGEKPIDAQVSLKVIPWTLPAPQDFKTWVETIQSPDTLAVEYGEPFWSDKLFSLISRSFDHCNEIGSRTLYIPLIGHTNLGNSETMVRWIQKGENKYDFDFSAMDKYLDLAIQHMGTPKIVVLQVWEIYMSTKESAGKRFGQGMADAGRQFQAAPLVTVTDSSGKTQLVSMPKLSDPPSKALWQSLITQVRDHMRKRSLDKALMYGMFTDAGPSKEDVLFFQSIAPDLPWVMQGHGFFGPGVKYQGVAPLGYQATVWDAKFCDSVPTHGTTDNDPMHGWRNKQLAVDFERNTALDEYPTTRWRQFAETCITGNMRGMGRVGADYWKAVRDKTGAKRAGWVHDRYPEGAWGVGGIYLNLANPVLAPAPQGPVATQHFEAFREGIQECEARIFIEQALLEAKGRLPADLAKRCEDALAERIPIMWKSLSDLLLLGDKWGNACLWRWMEGVPGHIWFVSSGWQQRSETLYSLAAEVSAKLGK